MPRSARARVATAQVVMVRGDDPALVAQEARTVLGRLVGDREPSLVVEEHGAPGADLEVKAVVDACLTPPFLADRRVVVVREAGRIGAADAGVLAELVATMPRTTFLVLVAGGGTVPQALVRAVSSFGEVVEASAGTGRDRTSWLAAHLRGAPVRLDAAARARVQAHLGDDLGRLAGILDALAAAYGEGAAISVDQLAPFLGSAGSVPPWELTDAIDAGSTASALGALRRMLEAGGRAPTEVLGILHRHYANMLRLDGLDLADPAEVAELLGVRSPFVAKKTMEQGRRLGGDRIAQAVALLADADLDVKGRTALPAELVLEVLVARLSRLVRARAGLGR
jgi:DNA polymerase-3 subunit delta